MFTPYAVRGILNKYYKKEKAIDISTICDLIAYISLLGPIPRNVSFEILNLIESLTVDHFVPIPIINSLRSNLFDQTRNRQQLASTLSNLSDRLPSLLYYSQLSNLEFTITDHALKWVTVFRNFAKTSTHPIYVDTENLYEQPQNRSKVALVTFYDHDSKIILIARVHRSSDFDLYTVLKNELRLLANDRKFATFSREIFLESMLEEEAMIINVQKNNESLQKAASRVGINLHKGQTMSNWGRPTLRDDQIGYAAMDVVSLHYILQEPTINANHTVVSIDG